MRRLMEWRCQGVVGVECERRSLDYPESAHVGHVMRRLGRGRRRPSCGNGGKIMSSKRSLDDVSSSSPRRGWIDACPL